MLFVPKRRRSSRLQSAIRAVMFAPPLCRSRRNEWSAKLVRRHSRFGFDEDGGSPANIAASGASHQTERAQRAEQ
jgi:hypothetical protein